jgi:hypothetical protein
MTMTFKGRNIFLDAPELPSVRGLYLTIQFIAEARTGLMIGTQSGTSGNSFI